jgi:ParB family chromosome partitioning protein
MSRKNTLSGIFKQSVEELAAANFSEESDQRNVAAPVKSMALTLGRMGDENRALHEALGSGQHVQELDPSLVDPSFVRDRLEEIAFDESDPFVRSIAENGQEVPILVRPHPTGSGRYQIAYGHRRLKAAALLGIKVKAVVRDFDDQSLVIAQGIENGERKNLSYIERVCFARTLERKGFSRHVIMKALSTDKTELSKMLSVASKLPDELTRLIGSAPGIGRRKWLALSDILSPENAAELVKVLTGDAAKLLGSDERFALCFKMLSSSLESSNEADTQWLPRSGGKVEGSFKVGSKSFVLSLKSSEARQFGQFLSERLDVLFDEYMKAKGE